MSILPRDNAVLLEMARRIDCVDRTPDVDIIPDIINQMHLDCEARYAEQLWDELSPILQDTVDRLEDRDTAASTSQKYLQLLTRFREYARAQRLPDGTHMAALPAKPELIAAFLFEDLVSGKSPASIKVKAAAIGWAHRVNDHLDPCQSPRVQSVLRYARHAGKLDPVELHDEAVTSGKVNGTSNGKDHEETNDGHEG